MTMEGKKNGTAGPCSRDPAGEYCRIKSTTIKQKVQQQHTLSTCAPVTTWLDEVDFVPDDNGTATSVEKEPVSPRVEPPMRDDSSSSVDPPPSQKLPYEDAYDSTFAKIASCTTVHDFLVVYDSYAYQSACSRIRSAMGTEDPETWAKEWAFRMRKDASTEDEQLNMDRKLCLRLLYAMCDCCWPPKAKMKSSNDQQQLPTVSETDLIHHFKTERIQNILLLALPMDRAQALYKMQYYGSICETTSNDTYGMYWVAQQHVDRSPMWGALLLSKCATAAARPTMNKRFIYLLELEALGLRKVPSIDLWLQPRIPMK